MGFFKRLMGLFRGSAAAGAPEGMHAAQRAAWQGKAGGQKLYNTGDIPLVERRGSGIMTGYEGHGLKRREDIAEASRVNAARARRKRGEDVWGKDPEIARRRGETKGDVAPISIGLGAGAYVDPKAPYGVPRPVAPSPTRNKPFHEITGLQEGGAIQVARRQNTTNVNIPCTGMSGCMCTRCVGGIVDMGFGSGWLGIGHAAMRRAGWLGAKGMELGGAGIEYAGRAGQWGTAKAKGAWGYLRGMSPASQKALGIGGLGMFGYATADEGGFQALERAAGFAAVGAGATSARFRGRVKETGAYYMSRIARAVEPKTTTGQMAFNFRSPAPWAAGYKATKPIMGGVGMATTAGAMYGAFSEDATILGGTAAGGALGLLGKGLIRHPIGTIATLGAGGILAGSMLATYDAVRTQRPNYDLGADGNVVLGLHSMRHG